ncbi:MAG: hypothetical protein AB7E37_05170 [Candidatus Altimarinota bacterium]
MEYNFEINLGFIKFGLKKTFDKFNSKKLSDENRELIWAKYEPVFEIHLKEMESIFIDCFQELKNNLTDKEDPKTKQIISKFENNLDGNVTENFDKTLEELKSNQFIMLVWNQFFYTDEMKKLFKNMNKISDKFISLLINEANNYYTSGKTVDIGLLETEKKGFIELFIYSIHKFEKLILEGLQKIFKANLVNSLKPGKEINEEQNKKVIQAIEKFASDIENGTMNKYYDRLEVVTDKILTDLILKLKK